MKKIEYKSAKTVINGFDVPILFIIFNDPIKSKVTFEQIKKIKPVSLYVAADGPRLKLQGEKERCIQTRKIIDDIDWPCKVQTYFRDENSGSAGIGVFSAISWFFRNVEEGIVLEYDVVPNIDFFCFCKAMLIKYRSSSEVKLIGGSNFQDGISRSEASYYFTKLPTLWGFATWRRAFEEFEFDIKKIDYIKFCSNIPYTGDKEFIRYWKSKFNNVKYGIIDTWDYPIIFSVWVSGGICVTANKNLATHFVDGDGYAENFNSHRQGMTNVPTERLLPIKFNSLKIINTEADLYLIEKFGLRISRLRCVYKFFRERYICHEAVRMLKAVGKYFTCYDA